MMERAVSVALVGVGGNGSQMLTGLARLDRAMRELGHPGGLDVVAYDPDTVSPANVGRQLYSPADVGLYKAGVLVHRVNLFYGLAWRAAPVRFEANVGKHHELLITCVDSAKSRRVIHRKLAQEWHNGPTYWLDLGNRQKDGQVILGQPSALNAAKTTTSAAFLRGRMKEEAKPASRLPTVIDLYPELLDESLVEDDAPSCSLAEALENQDLFINDHVSRWALQMLWELFRNGRIDYHGVLLNLESGEVNRIPVPAER